MKSRGWTAKKNEFTSRVLHDIAQPLTALECGIELSLLQDETASAFRGRLQKLLGIAQTLHLRLLELRAEQPYSGAEGTTGSSKCEREER